MESTGYPGGLKWTKQRKCVYNILKDEKEPVSAVEIYRRLLQTEGSETYAVSTVYRILDIFEEKGMVHKDVRSEDHIGVYELERGMHTHYAVCLVCHKRIPLEHCPVAHMHTGAGPENFTVTGHKLELYGYCGECR